MSNIPFDKIVHLLVAISKNTDDCAMCAINKFPDKLQEELTKWDVKYIPDLPVGIRKVSKKSLGVPNKWYDKSGIHISETPVDAHIFKTACCSLYIKFEFYKDELIEKEW